MNNDRKREEDGEEGGGQWNEEWNRVLDERWRRGRNFVNFNIAFPYLLIYQIKHSLAWKLG